MAARIQNKRGLKANQPTTGMLAGELFHHTDRGSVHVALDATNSIPIVTPIDDLTTLGSIAGADLMMIHDISGTGVMEKKVTFDAFKAALNIPSGSTDELVAVVSGGTSGYIWGTDGTDGVIRLNNSLSWTKDASDAFVTIAVETVDCGTF